MQHRCGGARHRRRRASVLRALCRLRRTALARGGQIQLVNGSGKTQAGDPSLRVYLKDGVILPGRSIVASLVFASGRRDAPANDSVGPDPMGLVASRRTAAAECSADRSRVRVFARVASLGTARIAVPAPRSTSSGPGPGTPPSRGPRRSSAITAPTVAHITANATQAYGQSNGLPTRIRPSLPPGTSRLPQPISARPDRQRSSATALTRVWRKRPAVHPPSNAPPTSAANIRARPGCAPCRARGRRSDR